MHLIQAMAHLMMNRHMLWAGRDWVGNGYGYHRIRFRRGTYQVYKPNLNSFPWSPVPTDWIESKAWQDGWQRIAPSVETNWARRDQQRKDRLRLKRRRRK